MAGPGGGRAGRRGCLLAKQRPSQPVGLRVEGGELAGQEEAGVGREEGWRAGPKGALGAGP